MIISELKKWCDEFLSKAKNNAQSQAMRDKRIPKMEKELAEAIYEQLEVYIDDSVLMQILRVAKAEKQITDSVNAYLKDLRDLIGDDLLDFTIAMGWYGGEAVMQELGIGIRFGQVSGDVIKQLSDRNKLVIDSVNNTTKDQIASILTRAKEAELTLDETASVISSQIEEISQNRAELIVFAETGNAVEATRLDTHLKNNIKEHRWITAGDNRVSDGCAANELMDWQKIGFVFTGGGTSVTRPQRHPRCRCYMEAKKDEAFFTEFYTGE